MVASMFKRSAGAAKPGAKAAEKEPKAAVDNAAVPNSTAGGAQAPAGATQSPPLVPRRSRLQQYSLYGGVVCMIWSLLMNMVRVGMLPPQLTLFAEVFPLWVVVALGALGLGSVGWQLVTLRDYPRAAEELQRDIAAARADLARRGFDFSAGGPASAQ